MGSIICLSVCILVKILDLRGYFPQFALSLFLEPASSHHLTKGKKFQEGQNTNSVWSTANDYP